MWKTKAIMSSRQKWKVGSTGFNATTELNKRNCINNNNNINNYSIQFLFISVQT